MKKIFIILLIVSLLLLLVGCTQGVGKAGVMGYERDIEYGGDSQVPQYEYPREIPRAPSYEYPEKRPVLICYEYTEPREIPRYEYPREPIEKEICCYFDKTGQKIIIPERDCKMKEGRLIDMEKCY